MKLVPPASSRLQRFQQQFQRALFAGDELSGDDSSAVAHLVAQPAFAVYRNTVLKGCIDALQANYPAVTRLVGEEWMRATAAVFARVQPPATPMLLEYGAAFADFLRDFAPAAELPYLAEVARLDRFWNEAHTARDEAPLTPAAVARLAPDQFERASLRPHASARWAWFDEQPIFTIWSRNRNDNASDAEIAWQGEGALVVRPFDVVQTVALGHAGCVFLDACANRRSLADAAAAALAIDERADFAQLLARLLTAGAFSAIDLEHDTQ
jgi:Putative DNA-binding domain